jgi:ribosomal protein L11 methyltransferase
MDAFDSKHLRMGAKGEWLELSLQVDLEAVEAVSEVLTRYGHQGGIVIEEAHRPAADGVSLERDPTRPAWVRAYVPQDHVSDETIQRIEMALSLLGELRPISTLRVRVLSEKDWAGAWKKHYSVLHVSERIVVVPAWKRFRPRPGQVALRLDPGMAFGTGIHPTTQLCLRALERLLRPGARVLDLGTGSGILAIAAAKLGCGPILAVDRDPIAVTAARGNIRRNRLSARIEVREGTLVPGMGPYDLILANLLAPVLRELADALAQALAPAGIVIASGVLSEQAGEVTTVLEAAGLRFVEQVGEGDWIALVMTQGAAGRA